MAPGFSRVGGLADDGKRSEVLEEARAEWPLVLIERQRPKGWGSGGREGYRIRPDQRLAMRPADFQKSEDLPCKCQGFGPQTRPI